MEQKHFNFKNRVGEKHMTNEGYEITIIEYHSANNCTIQFEDNVKLYNITYNLIKNGSVRNPNHKSVFGVGYLGVGSHVCSKNGKITKKYNVWAGMLQRCYDEKYHTNRPTYIGCTVDPRWHNFQGFGDWFDQNYRDGYVLDKDILVKGNKIYSPENCCFVPPRINSLFVRRQNDRGNLPIGVTKIYNKYRAQIIINKKHVNIAIVSTPKEAFQAFKAFKESYIKEIANEWKSQISSQVYQAMYEYQIEITD